MKKKELLRTIEDAIKNYFEEDDLEDANDKVLKIPLMKPFYNHLEIMQVIDSLLKFEITLNQMTNNKVRIFEDLWKNYIRKNDAIMVNSGSSANLLALNVITNSYLNDFIKPDDEIITPALTWTTTVSPIWSVHCKPVFVDVDPNSFTIIPEEIRKAIGPKTRAIMPVHLLGYPCNMDEIMKIAKEYNLFVIEDCCEAHGAELDGKKVGSFGDISTFSFFFSHHLTTMEGGMVLTDNTEYSELIRLMRSQGVMRNSRNEEFKNKYYNDPEYNHIQKNYLFANIGFNLRPTELNGGFGIEQFNKFPEMLRIRKDNAEFFLRELKPFSDWIKLPEVPSNINHAWFAIPIYIKDNAPFTRKDIEAYLNTKGIETRQIMTGNITQHPAMKYYEYRINGELKNTNLIHKNAFFFGNHPRIREKERNYIMNCFLDYFKRY